MEDAEAVPIEWYRDRYPELDDESLVALLYEEYCLREEDGETPDAADYRARFPHIADSFREVLEIHDLVGRGRATALRGPARSGTPFPEAGQTIAGFRLVEELGRGAFSRAYLAEEQHLADRPVALKVTRTGSREPQMLARLQHTHIVPVYSYRTDPVTGLHLLCMPYLGRITLQQILRHPGSGPPARAPTSSRCWTTCSPPTATWWNAPRAAGRSSDGPTPRRSPGGARMAEALQHAHDRQVLHRDVKPSNVLVTGDGLPMLLDFNLAQEPLIDHAEAAPAAVGGTLAYMAPEHLEALAEGGSNSADTRSDLYALGVVLFDCLVRGERSFALPSRSLTMTEALLRAAEARRGGAPRLRDPSRRAAGPGGGGAPLPGPRAGRSLRLGGAARGRPPGGGRRRAAPLRPRADPRPMRPLVRRTAAAWPSPRPSSWHWGSPLACWSTTSSPRCALRPRWDTGSTRPDIRPKGASSSSP